MSLPPGRYRLGFIRLAAIAPSLMTSAMRAGSVNTLMSASGSPSTTIRSASLPFSTVPMRSRQRGTGLDRLHRRHARAHQADQLAGIGRVAVAAGVGAGDDLDPGIERPPDRQHMMLFEIERASADIRPRRFAVVVVD